MAEEEEKFLTSCDLSVNPSANVTLVKGCIIRNDICEGSLESEPSTHAERIPFWRKIILCQPCFRNMPLCDDLRWKLAVCCSGIAPERCHSSALCSCLDRVSIAFIYEQFFGTFKLFWGSQFTITTILSKMLYFL